MGAVRYGGACLRGNKIGGYALALHGAPRCTGDLAVLAKPDPGNAQHTLAALEPSRTCGVDARAAPTAWSGQQ